jgi:16S rRNA (cytosine967-C5)-methyltransferase
MRLGGRLAAAIDVLSDIEQRHRPAGDALRDWGLSHRFAGSGDRAAIGNMVYDALRRKRMAAWLMDDDSPRGIVMGAHLLEGGLTPQALNDTLEGDRFAPEPLTATEMEQVATRSVETAPDEIRADCPDWCVPLLQRSFGEHWVDEAEALAKRPPLDLRANTLLSSRDKVATELRRVGARTGDLSPAALRIAPVDDNRRHPNVQAEPAFQKGWFEIQDEGSQVVSMLAGAEPGQQVLDYCAGGGGKTLALAAAMENTGQIFAHDAEKPRLAPIFDRLRRAGARNVQVIAEAEDLQPLAARMDLVLVDAPCTGSGTWRRRPDAKWRLTDRQLDVRRREQSTILDAAAAFVRPGGRLVYVTCSVFVEENADQIEAFLERRPDFEPINHEAEWQRRFAGKPHISGPLGISLTPLSGGTDGFFCSILQRAA